MAELLRVTTEGLYCEAGDFFIDPWRPVARAVITHGHADHARGGCASYLASVDGLPVLRARLGADAPITTVAYGETVQLNGVHISLHPAGHILGSAQVRVEHKGDVWVASGDYKNGSDPTCLAMEPVRCRVFISESTFGLPIYRWNQDDIVRSEILDWWTECKNTGRVALLLGYSLGKAQRLLAMVGQDGPGQIVEHAKPEWLCHKHA
jgi:putative mRNA 3-end processing factor